MPVGRFNKVPTMDSEIRCTSYVCMFGQFKLTYDRLNASRFRQGLVASPGLPLQKETVWARDGAHAQIVGMTQGKGH